MKSKNRATLEKILTDNTAKKSLSELVRRGVDKNTSEWFLQTLRLVLKIRRRRIGSPSKRQLGVLYKKLLDVAKSIELANRFQDVFAEVGAFVAIKAVIEPESPLSHLTRLPVLLREYARILELIREMPKPTVNLPSRKNELIVNLLLMIKERTGRACYEHVATLLNAVDVTQPQNQQFLWDATNLGQLMHRERKVERKADRNARRIVKSTSVPTRKI
jgi:hypothetical protein